MTAAMPPSNSNTPSKELEDILIQHEQYYDEALGRKHGPPIPYAGRTLTSRAIQELIDQAYERGRRAEWELHHEK